MNQKASTKDYRELWSKNNRPNLTPDTGVDPYKKAQSYLKAMLPAITEALPKSKGMDAERLSRITLTTLRTNPKLLECSVESLLGLCPHKRSVRPRTDL